MTGFNPQNPPAAQVAAETQQHRPYEHGDAGYTTNRPQAGHTDASKASGDGWGSNKPSSERRDEKLSGTDVVSQKREDKAIDKEPDFATGQDYAAPPGDNSKTLGEFEAERKSANK